MTEQPAGPSNTGRRVAVNVSALATASLVRIGLSFALQLMVARFLGVAALGLYAATLAYIHLFQVVSDWGLPTLLPRDLAQQPHHRRAGYRAALVIQISVAVAIWLGVTVVTPWLPAELGRLLWIGSVTLPFYAVMSASETLCEACERMSLVMVIEVFANVLLFAVSAFILLMGGQLPHLLIVAVVVQAIVALVSFGLVRFAGLLAARQATPEGSIGALMGRSLLFFSLSLADVLQQRIDLLLLSLLAGPTATGVYAAANNLVRVLVKLVQSYWRALYPTLSRLHQQQFERFFVLQGMALRLGWAATLLAAAAAAGLATEIVLLLFGAEFSAASAVLRILIWAAPLYLLESYFIAILFVQREPRASLTVGLAHLGVATIALPLLFMWAGLDGAAWGMVLAGVVGVCVGARHLRRLAATFATKLLIQLVVALMVAAVVQRFHETPLWALGGGAALYGLLTWLTGGVGRRDMAYFRQAFWG